MQTFNGGRPAIRFFNFSSNCSRETASSTAQVVAEAPVEAAALQDSTETDAAPTAREPAAQNCVWNNSSQCQADVVSLRQRYFSAANNQNACTMGGMFSQYINSQGAPATEASDARCKRVSSFRSYRCLAAQSICNPLLYGLNGDQPICVPSGAAVSQTCEEMRQPVTNDLLNQRGMEDEYNQLTQNFTAACVLNTEFGRLFCRACNRMGDRIAEINNHFGSDVNYACRFAASSDGSRRFENPGPSSQ